MKETKLNKAERMPEKEVQALIRRSGAEALVQFLNFDFARHGKTIKDVERYLEPRPRQYLYGDLLRFRIIKPARLRLAADYQKKLRTLLVPIFSARFAKSPVVDLEQKLVNEMGKLQGRPYRFEHTLLKGRLTEKWERNPSVEPKNFYEWYLGRAAVLFDQGTLFRAVGFCQECSKFFEASGTRGPTPDFCSLTHRNNFNNRKLRDEGYFVKKYQDRKASQRRRAKDLLKRFTVDEVLRKTRLSKREIKELL